MIRLPLYTDTRAAVEKIQPIADVDRSCTRCPLHQGVRTVCMGADGENIADSPEGAILVLVDAPTDEEDHAARPLSSNANRTLRALVEKHAKGAPIVYASALRCAPKTRNVTERSVLACASYTAGLIEEVKPSRVLCFGKYAYQAVLGSSPDSVQLGRRGYGYLSTGAPVFMLHAPRRVLNNRFLRRDWEKDVEWAITSMPDLPPWDGEILLIENEDDAREACADLERAGGFTYDTETGGLMGSSYFQVVCLAATPFGNTRVAYVWPEEAIKNEATVEPLREVLRNEHVGKIGHNLKYDLAAVAYGLGLRDAHGVIEARGARGDTLLWRVSFDTESKGALAISDHLVGMGGHKAENEAALEAAIKKIKTARADPRQRYLRSHPALRAAVANPDADEESFAYALVERSVLYRYCALDTVATARLHAMFEPIVERNANFKLLNEVVQAPATWAVAQIEAWGMGANAGTARLFGNMLTPKADEALAKLRALGCNVDLNSSQQVSKYLYEDLKLPVQSLTKKGAPSTDADALGALADRHPSVPLILEYAKINKLLGTYVKGLIPHIRDDGRIRTSINLAGARSGRTSSSNPNLQNIPSSGPYAKTAKSIFDVAPGNVMLQLDYSQLEVRIAAMLSQDRKLIQAYLDGADVHRRTAASAFKVDEKDVTKEQRRNAKAVVFGVLYGKTPRSLAKDLGVSVETGQVIYDSVLGVYDSLTHWMQEQRAFVEKNGVVWTVLPMDDGKLHRARVRQLWQIADPDDYTRSRARNAAVNTPVQGSASEFMMRTLIAVVKWIVDDGVPARVVNTVHDSIILEVPNEWALEVAAMVKHIMESWPSCGVPLVADVDVGLHWGALHKLQGLQIVAAGKRNGLTDDEIIHAARGDGDLADEIGGDPAGWLARVSDLASRVRA